MAFTTMGEASEEKVAWSLAVILSAMSEAALHGLRLQHTQAVVDHLACVAADDAVMPALRKVCGRLADLWEDVHLQ